MLSLVIMEAPRRPHQSCAPELDLRLWLGKIMKAGVEWLLTTATGSAELRPRIMTEREQQFYCEPSITWAQSHIRNRNVYLHKLKIMSIMCLLSVWESQLFWLKKCPKKLSIIMSHIFLSTWSVLPCPAHSTPLLLGHACRKGHVPPDMETRVVTTPWKITLQQHVLRLVSRNLCVVVSGLHLLLCVVVLHQPIRGPWLWPSGQLDAWHSLEIFHSYSFQWPTWQCLIWRLKNEDIRLILRWISHWTSIMPATSARQQLSRAE